MAQASLRDPINKGDYERVYLRSIIDGKGWCVDLVLGVGHRGGVATRFLGRGKDKAEYANKVARLTRRVHQTVGQCIRVHGVGLYL